MWIHIALLFALLNFFFLARPIIDPSLLGAQVAYLERNFWGKD